MSRAGRIDPLRPAAGFTLRARDETDRMFAVFRLVKADAPPTGKPPRWPQLKACEYKRR